MTRIAYVDGRYLRHGQAGVSIEDRALQFSDGVYEVCAVLGKRLLDESPHLDRLERSLAALRIAMPMSRRAMSVVLSQVIRRNYIRDGLIYFQVTRGTAPRDHPFPDPAPQPTLIVAARALDYAKNVARQKTGVAIKLVEDQRWARRDIKSVSLLANVLAKQAAREVGAFEAWQVDGDGKVTEGASTNAWIVTADGALMSRRANQNILRGVTREALIQVARQLKLKFIEQPFTPSQAYAAKEAFTTSSSIFIVPVVSIDGKKIGDGKPGPVTLTLLEAYWRAVGKQTGVNYWRR